MTDDLSEDFDEDESEEDVEALERLKQELQRRCKSAGMKIEEREFFDEDKNLVVAMPNGRETRWNVLTNLESLEKFLSIPFERYTYLAEYAAVCSYEDGTIEAIVRGLTPGGTQLIRRRLFNEVAPTDEDEEEEPKTLELSSEGAGEVLLSLGPVSTTLLPLMRMQYARPNQLSLKVSGVEISRHDQTVQLLERLANSLFYEIDLTLNAPLTLAREYRPRGIRRRPRPEKPPTLVFPKHEYDSAPISLYWYARSAIGMPLLQYLAFYQVMEFYFPTYSQKEAGRKLRTVLKDPTFRPDRDSDIGRLLSMIGSSRSGAFGDERAQLRATLQECIDPDLLRSFLLETEQRKEFFPLSKRA